MNRTAFIIQTRNFPIHIHWATILRWIFSLGLVYLVFGQGWILGVLSLLLLIRAEIDTYNDAVLRRSVEILRTKIIQMQIEKEVKAQP